MFVPRQVRSLRDISRDRFVRNKKIFQAMASRRHFLACYGYLLYLVSVVFGSDTMIL